MTTQTWLLELAYLAASVLFIFGLRLLQDPETARRGMFLAEIGMGLAIVGTLFHHEIITFEWIVGGCVVGSIAGYVIAMYTPMTAMPQRTAFSHAFGAAAASLVGVAEFYAHGGHLDRVTTVALGFEILLGGLTFTGSMMAFAKLQEWMRGSPVTYPGQNFSNLAVLAGTFALLIYQVVEPNGQYLSEAFYGMIALSLLFGVLLVLPIGAADMPVVISLLNSYAGLAACATGFVLDNKLLIIAGALDGASGVVLSIIMCRAMNRSILNVLFGAFGKAPPAGAKTAAAASAAPAGEIAKVTAQEAAALAMDSKFVIFVPGYGMAAAQAQHGVREFADVLKARGVEVKYAIHPVAGRMPGHMNVLLAEARVPYEELVDMEDINSEFPRCDLAIVMGANDVTNPAAKNNPNSPIFGMPVLEVENAKRIIVAKRGMSPGFAGIDNELYGLSKTAMLFGDAKKTAESLAGAAKEIAAGGAKATITAGPAVPAEPEDPFYAGRVKRTEAAEVARWLGEAKRIAIVPGYGAGRAQAQLALRDLIGALSARGKEAFFAVHPYAGRSPGQVNFLLADADVPYDLIRPLDPPDGILADVDVVLTVGANDVTNPEQKGPLLGMPGIDLAGAKHVIVLKRGLGHGFCGVPNPLYVRDNTALFAGDAKRSLEALVSSLRR